MFLTKQQKWIVGITIGLLVLGWITKTWRLAEKKAEAAAQMAQ